MPVFDCRLREAANHVIIRRYALPLTLGLRHLFLRMCLKADSTMWHLMQSGRRKTAVSSAADVNASGREDGEGFTLDFLEHQNTIWPGGAKEIRIEGMMKEEIQAEMQAYYNERAKEHDLVYMGKGPAIHQYSAQYVKDVAEISNMAAGFGIGHLIDIACGTGFWAPHYGRNCSAITFVDQSENMLSECRSRFDELGLEINPYFIRGNFFDVELGTSAYDCALIGFLLSHFMPEQEENVLEKLKRILAASGQIMIIDSIWNEKREQYRQKTGIEKRVLNDGRTFRVYKKYFEQSEIKEILEKRRFALRTLYAGDMLIAAIAERTG